MIKIGTAPDSWGIWYPEDEPGWIKYLDEAGAAGYEYSELGPFGYMPKDKVMVAYEMEKRRMGLCGGTLVGALGFSAQYKKFTHSLQSLACYLEELSVPYLIIMDESEAWKPQEKISLEQWHQMTAYLKELKKIAQDSGVSILFHPHLGTCVESEEEILKFLNDTDYQLCFDTGHHRYTGADPFAFIEKYSSRIDYLHVKNIDASVRERVERESLSLEEAVLQGVMCELEKGILDFAVLRDLLQKKNFSGYVVVEQDMRSVPSGTSLRCAKNNLEYLNKIDLALNG